MTEYSDIKKSNWTEFQDVNKELKRSVKAKNEIAGVYKFRIVDENNKPYHIVNACGSDIYGIIYIGSTSSLKRRFSGLTRAITDNKKSHSGGRAFYRIKNHNAAFIKSYPNAKLQVSYKELPDEKSANLYEKKLLRCYTNLYVHRPILNSLTPDEINTEYDGSLKKDLELW